jgi:hypothetical protein
LMYVDMNRDGRRDNRETVARAWRRLGLLGANERFDRAKYVACVWAAAGKLANKRLLTEASLRLDEDEAAKADLPAE